MSNKINYLKGKFYTINFGEYTTRTGSSNILIGYQTIDSNKPCFNFVVRPYYINYIFNPQETHTFDDCFIKSSNESSEIEKTVLINYIDVNFGLYYDYSLNEFYFCDVEKISKNFLKTCDSFSKKEVSLCLTKNNIPIIKNLNKKAPQLYIKHRNCGATTSLALAAAYAMCNCRKYYPRNVVVLTPKQDMCKEIMEKTKGFINTLPNHVNIKTDSSNTIILTNDSKISGCTFDSVLRRGIITKDVTHVIIDEASFCDSKLLDDIRYLIKTLGIKLTITTSAICEDDHIIRYMLRNTHNEYQIHKLNWFNDHRLNDDLTWSKNSEIIKCNYCEKSNNYLYNSGWEPTSPRYEKMVEKFNDKRYVRIELGGEFDDRSETEPNKHIKKTFNEIKLLINELEKVVNK